MSKPTWPHVFVPSDSGPGGPALLLLHGTGADENDLVPIGRQLAPGVALVSPRGRVLENGMPRFFRRLAPGVFDEADLIQRTHELAGFAREASAAYDVDPARLWAVGYSNGANIAASLLLLHPELLRGAVLLRAMPPFKTPPTVTRSESGSRPRVLIMSGASDQMMRPEDAARLADELRVSGADVTLRRANAGHELTAAEVSDAGSWLREQLATTEGSHSGTKPT
ncbi:MAG: alpha/beta hydrolase [Gemmatimonadota bacterium]|nr:alpha/beta hydrolase [Gemmatimonadota bacterium]